MDAPQVSLRERRPGVWEVRVYAGRDPVTGKTRQLSRTVRGGKKAARAAEQALAAEATRNTATEATVAFVVDRVIAHLESIGRERATIHGYRKLEKLIANDRIAAMPWRDLRSRDVDAYYVRLTEQGYSPERVKMVHALLRLVGNWAMRWEWADRNVVKLATRPTVHAKRLTAPKVADVAAILRAADASASSENGIAFRLLALLGCRRGELCGLRWSDLYPRHITIQRSIDELPGGGVAVKSTKTHQARQVDLDDVTLALFRVHFRAMRNRDISGRLEEAREYATAEPYVFSDSLDCSQPWKPGRLTLAWSRARKVAGVEGIRLHDLRHFHASILLNAGEDAVVVAARLGHADAATTQRVYGHLVEGAGLRAAGIVSGALAAAESSEDS